MRALGDLPSQVKLAIYQLIAIEDRSKAELVFPSFKEIAQQLELETAGAGLMLMTDDCEHAPMMSMLSQMLLDDDMLGLLPCCLTMTCSVCCQPLSLLPIALTREREHRLREQRRRTNGRLVQHPSLKSSRACTMRADWLRLRRRKTALVLGMSLSQCQKIQRGCVGAKAFANGGLDCR